MGKTSAAKKVAYLGLMLALAVTLSFLENLVPPLPQLPPGVKLGLSNIVTMYCVFFVGKGWAFGVAALKAAFVFTIRGPVAACLSLSGGMLAVGVIVLLLVLGGKRFSYIGISICGAVAHNLAQIVVASWLLSTPLVFYYFPVLIVSGIFMGSVTGVSLTTLLPILRRTLPAEK